jgi:hypothetical protein
MKFYRAAIFLMVAAMAAGCAHDPVLTRDKYLAMTNREYPDRTPEQVIAAAERVLRLADGDDFQIADNPHGFVAYRNWSIYVVLAATMGTDTWMLTAEPSGAGSKVNLQVGRQAGSIIPVPTTNGAMTATGMPVAGNPLYGTATYDLFWARLDYMLHERSDWMTCKASNERVEQKIAWGDNSALCNSFNMKDRTPTGPMALRN